DANARRIRTTANEAKYCVFSSRRRHTRSKRDWSSDVCSSDLASRIVRSVLRSTSLSTSTTDWIPPVCVKSSSLTEDFTQTGGIQSVVDVLNEVDRSTERTILDELEIQDTELAEEIRHRMYIFEDIV